MTREEAIELLQKYKEESEEDYYVRRAKALDMAIRALEQESTEMGKWVIMKDEYGDIYEAVCSCCGINGNHKWAYCPNCGCKMQEVKDE